MHEPAVDLESGAQEDNSDDSNDADDVRQSDRASANESMVPMLHHSGSLSRMLSQVLPRATVSEKVTPAPQELTTTPARRTFSSPNVLANIPQRRLSWDLSGQGRQASLKAQVSGLADLHREICVR